MAQVSIIMPTHNRAELLRIAITSILQQTFQDYEILVIDDGSKDNTEQICADFDDVRLKYIRHKTNKGEAAARNTGLAHAAGEYIAFLDDDDEWLPVKLEKQVDLLRQSPLKVGGVYTGFITIERATGRVLGQTMPTKRGDIFREMASNNWVGTPSTVLLRKECFTRVGPFDEQIDYGPDYDMWIRIAKDYHFEYIQEPLVKYYVHNVQLSTNYKKLIRGHEAQLRKYGAFFALDRASYSRHYTDLGIIYCYNGEFEKGRQTLFKSIKMRPFEPRNYYYLALSLFGRDNFQRLDRAREKVFRRFRQSGIKSES